MPTRLSFNEHALRGTLRPDRHLPPTSTSPGNISNADRRRTLTGLSPEARRIAIGLLDTYDGWDAAGLSTLRLFAISAERVRALGNSEATSKDRRAEIRTYLELLKALNLEAPR